MGSAARVAPLIRDLARVLVTYGWCRTAYVALRSLRRSGHEVYACSGPRPMMCGWSRHCQGSAETADPFTAPEAFTRDVAELVRRWRIELVVPAHEDGLVLRRHEDLLPDGTRLACPDRARFESAVDKAWITRLAMGVGVPVPATRFPATVTEALAGGRELGYPLVVKLRRSNSGKGVIAVRDPAELESALRGRLARNCSSAERFPILQQLVEGSVVGACFLSEQGQLAAVFQERYVRCKGGAFGTSVFREPLPAPSLRPYVEKLVAALAWTGIGHFDFLLDRQTGTPLLLEMNPRLWGALNLAVVNGYDFPAALVAQSLGRGEPERFFNGVPKLDRKSLWVVGELIATVNRMRCGRWGEMSGALRDYVGSLGRLWFDDWVWSDPLPLVAEALCYGRMFLRSGGDTNPQVEGMLE